MTTTDIPVVQPDLAMVYAIHRALTEDAAQLAAAVADLAPEDRAERIPAIRRYYAAYTTQLVSHHTHEDRLFFPALVARVGPEAMALDQLEAQHHGLDTVIGALRQALDAVGDERTEFASAKGRAQQAVDVFRARLAEHLELEERVALPLYLANVPAAEHDEIVVRVAAMDPFEQLFFTVPWLFDRLPAPIRTGALAAAPEIFGTLYGSHVQEFRQLAQALRTRPSGQGR